MGEETEELVFIPLGGTGEIGMNCNLYGFGAGDDKRYIMVDLGVMFGGAEEPGIDAIMADTSFIEEKGDALLALFLTHGHEDHIGAVEHMWARLQCPIYATRFTAALLMRKLSDRGSKRIVEDIHIVEPEGRVEIGPFTVDYVALTHSIAEPNALTIRVRGYNVLHTGDWKIDEAPQIGTPFDRDKFKAIGDKGIDAIVCDSTNALEDGRTGSESEVARGLDEAIADCGGCVFVTGFASNIARMSSIGYAARAHGRHVALLGLGMHRMYEVARAAGYLEEFPLPVLETEIASIPRENLLVICTGSQGQSNAALARIANGSHHIVNAEAGDRVVFSSRKIPGNEKAVAAMQNDLVLNGVEIITPDAYTAQAGDGKLIHVSGHPCRDDLAEMYQLIRPRAAVPVHGEARHLSANAEVAALQGVSEPIDALNGDIIRLAPAPAELIGTIEPGRVYRDGKILCDDFAYGVRRRLADAGFVHIVLTCDEKGIYGTPSIHLVGLPDEDNKSGKSLYDHAARAVEASLGVALSDIRDEVRDNVGRALKNAWGKLPLVEVTLVPL